MVSGRPDAVYLAQMAKGTGRGSEAESEGGNSSDPRGWGSRREAWALQDGFRQ
jgi:hypothetical protein